jgi:hypothetical protein
MRERLPRAERGSMAEEKVPESWIGEHVGLLIGAQAEPVQGELLEVHDRGVVISYLHNLEEFKTPRDIGEHVEPLFLPFFYPWHSVVGIHKMPVEGK